MEKAVRNVGGFAPYLTRFILASRQKPALYWTDNSLKTIRAFMDGFSGALGTFAPQSEREAFPKIEFTNYVAARLEMSVGTMGWAYQILERYADDGSAVNKFIELYEEFVTGYEIVEGGKRLRIVRFKKLRGYFVVTLPTERYYEDFCFHRTLPKARAYFRQRKEEAEAKTHT